MMPESVKRHLRKAAAKGGLKKSPAQTEARRKVMAAVNEARRKKSEWAP